MIRIILLISPLLLLGNVQAAPQASEVTIKQTETHGVFKGVLLSVWSRLRAYNPQQNESANAKVLYTSGIRGAEATDTLIQPYWKGDLTHDEVYQKHLDQFTQAQQLMDKGELIRSAEAFDLFIEQYENSYLLPNALFGKGLSLAANGDKSAASEALNQFVDSNPNHPLVADARQVLQQFN